MIEDDRFYVMLIRLSLGWTLEAGGDMETVRLWGRKVLTHWMLTLEAKL